MYELSENIGEILEEIEESRNRGSYSMYLSQGGRLKEMDFEKVLGYQPTDANINEVTTLFPHMSYDDKVLVAKIYKVVSDRRLCILTDPEIYCEYLVFTNQLKSFFEARLAEEKEKRKK